MHKSILIHQVWFSEPVLLLSFPYVTPSATHTRQSDPEKPKSFSLLARLVGERRD